MGVVNRARVAMVEEQRTEHGPSGPVEREVILRMRAERRLVEQELKVRGALLVGTLVCSAVGLAMLVAGNVFGGCVALAVAAKPLPWPRPAAAVADEDALS